MCINLFSPICGFVDYCKEEMQKNFLQLEKEANLVVENMSNTFKPFLEDASHVVEKVIEEVKKPLLALSEQVSVVFSTACLFFQPLPSEEDLANVPLSLYDITVKKLNGEELSLSEFKGRPLLIVNIASRCGLVGQMDELEELQKTFKDISILAFPSDDFLGQEPGTAEEVKERYEGPCKLRSFQVLGKVKTGGRDRDPLYLYLTSEQRNPHFSGNVQWNFTKFLIGKDGQVADRFAPTTSPTSEAVQEAIKKAL